MTTIAERLWPKIERAEVDACWEFRGGRTDDGYGRFVDVDGRVARAHRITWEQVHGPIPEGLSVLHSCDNPPCCNPAHLFLGTQADNVADMIAKGRWRGAARPDACPAGHLYDGANTAPDGHCRTCGRDRARDRRSSRGRVTTEQRRRNSRYGMHLRWHARRGTTNPECEFC